MSAAEKITKNYKTNSSNLIFVFPFPHRPRPSRGRDEGDGEGCDGRTPAHVAALAYYGVGDGDCVGALRAHGVGACAVDGVGLGLGAVYGAEALGRDVDGVAARGGGCGHAVAHV